MGNHCAKKHGHKFVYKLPDKLQKGLLDFGGDINESNER